MLRLLEIQAEYPIFSNGYGLSLNYCAFKRFKVLQALNAAIYQRGRRVKVH